MNNVTWPFLLIGLALAGPAVGDRPTRKRIPRLSSKQHARIKAQLTELFRSADRKEADRLLSALRALPPIGSSDASKLVKRCMRLCALGFRIPARGKSFTIPFEGKTGTVYISGTPAPNKPLFIGLHGGALNQGSGEASRGNWGRVTRGTAVGLFPTFLRDVTWDHGQAHRYIQALIKAARRSWGIDTNRVYLAGHSLGGFGTWSAGCNNPDLFAALASGAGGGYQLGVPFNIFNTPIYFYHSTDDQRVGPASDQDNNRDLIKLKRAHPKGYRFVYKEYTDIGHGFPKTGLGPVVAWQFRHRRNPYPKKLLWEPPDPEHEAPYSKSLGYKRQCFWLYSAEPARHGRIIAQFTGPNELTIDCKDPEGLVVLLNKKLINFEKPLRVLHRDRPLFDDYVYRSAWAIADSIYRRQDPKMYFTASVTLKKSD